MLATKKKKINGWDDAIAQTNAAIVKLRRLIATCQQHKAAGIPFPTEGKYAAWGGEAGSWNEAIFNASCHLAKIEETVKTCRTARDAGHSWLFP
jgi:hypothetical protein